MHNPPPPPTYEDSPETKRTSPSCGGVFVRVKRNPSDSGGVLWTLDGVLQNKGILAVSYTHLTLPTILRV